MEKINKFIKENLIQIFTILAGTIMILIPAFHTNIWFDESYTLGITGNSFMDIWVYGSGDVHPPFYYFMIKIVSLIFGESIILYRLFSILPIVLMGILGITHIKKDFGPKVGILFTFFTFFMPTVLTYASEIRMYSWEMLFVTIASIYAYRFIKYKNIKMAAIFGIFSLLSCYTHYYGLMCLGLINVALVIFAIVKRKEMDKKVFIGFAIIEVLQVVLYLPWLFEFIGQLISVSGGFWITLQFPDVLINVLNFHYVGTIGGITTINKYLALSFAVILYIYIAFLVIRAFKKKEDVAHGITAILIYKIVILAALIVSLIASPILYERYLFTITGLLIFALSYFLAKSNNKYILSGIVIVLVSFSVVTLADLVEENYDSRNLEARHYMEETILETDTILFENIGVGGVVAATIDNTNMHFINTHNWGIDLAYKAYLPNMQVSYDDEALVKNAEGRVVIIEDKYGTYADSVEALKDMKEVETKVFEAPYADMSYKIRIFENLE